MLNNNSLKQAIQQQQLATNPLACAWVSASAGTGKTKVLIDRLLALLLSGVNPEHILCLTFTKAGAAEIQQRLLSALQNWILQSEDSMQIILAELLGMLPTAEQLKKARQLYTEAMEAGGGLKIETIHGFCQTLLSKFPLEAGIIPQPKVIDEQQAKEILKQAKQTILGRIFGQEDFGIKKVLMTHFKDASFQDLLDKILKKHHVFRKVLEKYPTIEAYTTALCRKMEISPIGDLFVSELRASYFKESYILASENHVQLLNYADSNPIVAKWLVADNSDRVLLFDEYKSLYLTQKGKTLERKKIDCEGEESQIHRLNKDLEKLELAQKSACIFYLGAEVFHEYQNIKYQQNLLDYEDLIEKTIALLTLPNISPWVLYKLDGGIRHLLVDEAQDNSFPQWQVIQALTQDFLTPQKKARTIFVVGDIKQSIYSFQGASPADFIKLRVEYYKQCQAIGQPWYDIDLQVSFRSIPEILSAVDQVVNHQDHQRAIKLNEEQIRHLPFRISQKGSVYLLPAVLLPKQPLKTDVWTIPDQSRQTETALDRVSWQVSLKIQQLLAEQIILPATGKPVQPKDILILVKKRGLLAPALIRSLKKQGIPVAGTDRFFLTSHLAVQDLIAIGQFLLLPDDDLTLACVLKGPLVELTEAELFFLATPRVGSLWDELKQRYTESINYQRAFEYLQSLLREVDYLNPYALYQLILYKENGLKKFRKHFGSEADDALLEFLNYAFKSCCGQPVSLQQFLSEIENTKQEIKRDGADNTQNQIRLLTVHGAKGLQAPVVFIIEQFKNRPQPESLLWEIGEDGKGKFMIVRPGADNDTNYTASLKKKVEAQENSEDKRLLYVALTRAQDHLFLIGYGEKEIPEDSWYQYLRPHVPIMEFKEDYPSSRIEPSSKTIPDNRLDNPVKHRKIIRPESALDQQTFAMQRGIIIHKLFELLLDLEPAVHQAAANFYLGKHSLTAADIPLTDILSILQSEMIQPFCKGQAISEVEIVDKGGKLQRLDRVVINDEVIKILDFKTSLAVPANARLTPKSILRQLADYRNTMQHFYPTHRIECYVLWTAAPVLHYVPDELLKSLSDMG